MNTTSHSVRFQVHINGKIAATAALEDYGILDTFVNWIASNPAAITEAMRNQPDFDEELFLAQSLHLSLSGCESDTSVKWLELPLVIGNEITIRILPPGKADPPALRERRVNVSRDFRQLRHLQKSLSGASAANPNEAIRPSDWRAVTLNSVLNTVESKHPDLSREMRVDTVTPILILHERVVKILAVLVDEN